MKPSVYVWWCIAATVVIVSLNLMFRYHQYARNVAQTLSTYAIGNSEDYHQYMYILKRGAQGHFLYHNAYSEEDIPDVFLQPFYHSAGFLLGKTGMSVYTMYFVLHIASLCVLLLAIYALIYQSISSTIGRIFALMLTLTATGFWTVSSDNMLQVIKQYLPDYNFDLIMKYHVMQPHHDIATALFILALLLLGAQEYTLKKSILVGICGAALGLIHPFIQYFLYMVVIIEFIFKTIRQKNISRDSLKKYVLPLIISLPTTALTYYILVYILRFEIGTKGIISYLPRVQSISDYILSLGPLLFLSLTIIPFFKKLFAISYVRLLIIWSYVPILLFFLPDIGIPMNTWRLFQTYQHIPLAILSALGVIYIVKRAPKVKIFIPIIGVVSLLYGSVIYAYGYKEATKPDPQLIWSKDVPYVVIHLLSYIDTHSPVDSVVLAGGVLSNIIPEFTHNRVIIGHNGNNRNFLTKLKEVGWFLSGGTPPEMVREFLDRYHVRFIVFGLDAPPFRDTPYTALPFLKEVYVDPVSGFSVVAVTGEK